MHFPEPAFTVLCGYAIEDFDHDAQAERSGPSAGSTRMSFRRRTVPAPWSVAGLRTSRRATAEPVVCVIDDDLSVRRSLSRLLVLAGCEVRVFASADEFLRDPGRRDAGCLILDVQLVGLSSQELQSRLAGEPGGTPVVAMSGSHDPQVETEAMRLGAAAFLRKPFEAEADGRHRAGDGLPTASQKIALRSSQQAMNSQ